MNDPVKLPFDNFNLVTSRIARRRINGCRTGDLPRTQSHVSRNFPPLNSPLSHPTFSNRGLFRRTADRQRSFEQHRPPRANRSPVTLSAQTVRISTSSENRQPEINRTASRPPRLRSAIDLTSTATLGADHGIIAGKLFRLVGQQLGRRLALPRRQLPPSQSLQNKFGIRIVKRRFPPIGIQQIRADMIVGGNVFQHPFP